jgi:hypothetical protein
MSSASGMPEEGHPTVSERSVVGSVDGIGAQFVSSFSDEETMKVVCVSFVEFDEKIVERGFQ